MQGKQSKKIKYRYIHSAPTVNKKILINAELKHVLKSLFGKEEFRGGGYIRNPKGLEDL
jgi:hypothetical protein